VRRASGGGGDGPLEVVDRRPLCQQPGVERHDGVLEVHSREQSTSVRVAEVSGTGPARQRSLVATGAQVMR
jgi:hypothetical protein